MASRNLSLEMRYTGRTGRLSSAVSVSLLPLRSTAFRRAIDLLDQRGIGRAEMVEIMTQRGNENREYLEVVEILRHVSTL